MTQQGYVPYEVQASIKTLDELLRQQDALLGTFNSVNTPGSVTTAYTQTVAAAKPTAAPALDSMDNLNQELAELFKNDKELNALFNAPQSSASQTPSYAHQPQKPASSIPSTIEDIFSNQQPALQPVSVRQPPVSEIKSYTQSPAQPQPARHPAVTQAMSPLWEQLDRFAENRASRPKPAEPAITEKQMQALGKKHLWMMILDLQEKLERAEEENETILQALQVGYAQGQRIG